ncbi:MAG: leader peptidase (prepilin peptidase) / N-methyltransferase [Actinomycetota bacterium]
MNTSLIAVTAIAALAGVLVTPLATRAIRDTPPDPEDDPQPVPSVGPWLTEHRMLAPLLAVVGGAVALRTGAHPEVAAHVVVALGLVVLSVIDLDLFLLPKRIVYPLLAVTAVLLAAAALADGDGSTLGRALLASLGAWGALLVLHLVSPSGMGFGDVRLALLIGLDLGWLGTSEVILGIFAGFLLAAVIGLLLIVTRVRGRRDAVPFGPFLAAGTLFVLVGGDALAGITRR